MENGTLTHAESMEDSARGLCRRVIMPLPIPYGEKNPNRPGWERERYTIEDLSAFAKPVNVGMLLGYVTDERGRVLTDKFIDVDLDTMEAIRAAPFYLPKTGMIWGRSSKPRSHYGYRLTSLEGAKHAEFKDPTPRKVLESNGLKAMLCELRFTGKQTLAPGSVNVTNGHAERVRWEPDGDGDPATTDAATLTVAMMRIGAASLLARYWSDGVRHQATLPLAGLLARGGLSERDALIFVEAVCTAAGESSDVIAEDRLRCVRDTYARAANGDTISAAPTLEEYFEPKIIALVRKWLALNKTAYGGDVGPDGWPLSDVGNAERFHAKWVGQLLYCDDEGGWYWYDRTRWRRDRQNVVYVRSVEVLNDFRALAASQDVTRKTQGNTTPEQWALHARFMGQMKQIRAMQEGAKALLAVLPEEFDADPLLLNVQNGTLELDVKTGTATLRDHKPEDLLTKQWAAPYLPNATHPLLDEYLQRFFPESDRRAFYEEAVGYSITGLPKRWSIQLLGPTHAGKGMTLHLLHKHAGDYGGTLQYTALQADMKGSGGDKPRSDLLGLVGKRVVTIAEIPPGTHFDVALFKTLLSGGDRMLVRAAHARAGREVEFTFTLWTSGNEVYGPASKDAAAFGRLAVLKCDHAMKDGEGDDILQMQTEDPSVTGAAFLALAVRGFSRVYGEYRGVLQPPEVVRQATQSTREQLDHWAPIVDELFYAVPGRNCGVAKVFAWALAKEAWERLIGPRSRFSDADKADFENTLVRRGAEQRQRGDRLGNRLHWKGLLLRDFAGELLNVTDHDCFGD